MTDSNTNEPSAGIDWTRAGENFDPFCCPGCGCKDGDLHRPGCPSTTDRHLDRTTWAKGPWDAEPDRVEWRSPEGVPLLIVRGPRGALCGYAGVAPGHPLHGQEYRTAEDKLDVHGGLTYSAACAGHICHVPAPGEPDDIWWFGFDCAHAGDYSPGLAATIGSLPGRVLEPYVEPPLEAPWHIDRYRDIAYVRAEVEGLARQLVALASPTSSET